MKKLIYLMVLLVLCGCVKRKPGKAEGTPMPLQYAKGFSVKVRQDGVKFVTVADPQSADGQDQHHFALVPRGKSTDPLPDGYTKITVPIERCIVMTLPQLSGFVELNALDRITGMNTARTLQNKDVRQRISDGRIVQIGMEGNFDRELIIAAQPDVIFVSPSKRGGYDALTDMEVPLVPYYGYKEATALGQAEWIKFVALFTGQEAAADRYFNDVTGRYMALKQKADSVEVRPVVMNGRMLEGLWCAEGGRSVQAQMFRDAGASYVLDGNQMTSDIKMEFEEMYAKAAHADYWTLLNSEANFGYDMLQQFDSRYTDFKAFQQHHVVYCNIRQTAYRERSPMHPDWLLADYIYAFHPELMSEDYQPRFYSLMKE